MKGSFVGRDGFPQAEAQNGSMAEYVEIEDSPDGFVRQRTYMDRRGQPMPGPDRAYGQLQECDGRGLVVRLASLGPPDKNGVRHKIVDDKGNSSQVIEYDSLGNPTKIRYLDPLDKPTYSDEGIAGIQFEYDQRGNQIERACFDTADRPTLDISVAAQKIVQTYDSRDNVAETRYFGADGQPCALTNGYAITRTSHDERGRVTEWACFDEHDRPTIDKSVGNHKSVRTYDDRGRMLETRFFGVDGQPCPVKDGYAIIRFKYDLQGNRIGESYFDTQDRPIRMRLLATEVLPGGAGERVGLQAGDVLWQYDGTDVSEVQDLLRREKSPGTAPRKLLIHRNGQPLEFDVPPGLLGTRLTVRPESPIESPVVNQADHPDHPTNSGATKK